MNQPEKTSGNGRQVSEQTVRRAGTTDADWAILADHLEEFLLAWEANGFGPQLADHLPEQPHYLRRMVLVELIKADLEYRHNSDGPVLCLEDYLAEYPELSNPDGMPVELIHEEYRIRKRAGQSVTVDECLKRFPDKSDSIHRVFQIDATSGMEVTGDELTETFQPGERLDDFYLMSRLGSGAFGSVFLARQESMQRTVALKVSSDKGTEAQTLAQLDHPNIVHVYDQVRLPEQNLRLLYMQFAPGGTLQAVVKASRSAEIKSGRIVMQCIADAVSHSGVLSAENISLRGGLADRSWSEVVCQLGMELAGALHYAHQQGVLHRDVKPANVLLDANGTARLADFNISFGADVKGTDAASSFGGSLAYMSPEQLDACNPHSSTQPSDLDGRSDIYSLGVMLWELAYGDRPFDDEAVSGSWNEMLNGMKSLREDGADRPSDMFADSAGERLQSILQRCLMPDVQDRYANAGALARDLGLGLQPRVARLMQKSHHGWQRLAIAWPMCAFLLTAISPHGFAAVFNHFYNDRRIEAELPQAADGFFRLVIIINTVAFSIGIGCCIRYSLPVVRALRDTYRHVRHRPVIDVRKRSFQLSRFVTFLGITEWAVAGLIYPVALHVMLGRLELRWHLQFISSFLICGLVAAAYPFFLTATLSVKAFLPALLRDNSLRRDDVVQLQRLSDQSVWSLYLAGGVPAVGMMLLLVTQETSNAHSDLTLKILSLVGAVGFACALSLSKTLQADIESLQEAYRLQASSEE